jgi:hypothetical protein
MDVAQQASRAEQVFIAQRRVKVLCNLELPRLQCAERTALRLVAAA